MKNYINLVIFVSMLAYGFSAYCQPVAVDDYISPVVVYANEYSLNVIMNDYNTNGSLFKIFEVLQSDGSNPYAFYSDTSITFIAVAMYEQVFKYRLCQIPDTTILSNWAYVTINPTLNSNYPVAQNDTVSISPGDSIYVDILANDFDPNGDSIYIKPAIQGMYGVYADAQLEGNHVKIKLSFDDYSALNQGSFSLRYYVSDTFPINNGNSDQGLIYVKIENGNYFDYLDINNIKARFSCFGNHFWDFEGQPEYYFPNGSTKTTGFANTFWIGGQSYGADTVLHLAADRFMAEGGDYTFGPISEVTDLAYKKKWFRTWKLNREEIEYHNQNWWQPGYVPIDNILEWPGNGDVSLGQATQLAPFHDNDNDGVYEPLQGDYPYIRGDQAIFFIFNDAQQDHFETQGAKLGIEIQGMTYAFDEPNDPALWNTVFLHYDIINRSDTTYYNTYIGNFNDADIGYAQDDFVGCNVPESYFYIYNADSVDGNGQINAYGNTPPVMAVKILAGPFMDPDNLDNPSGACDESVNGTGFSDTIIDNERFGMTSFRYFNNGSSGPMKDPKFASDYYNYLTGKWLDGSQMVYGGTGHYMDPDATSQETFFMFPGTTDTCGWGQGSVPMQEWDEIAEDNPSGDRRGLGVSGPFTFEPGQTQSVDFAFINAFGDSTNYLSAIDSLTTYSQYLTLLFENNSPIFNDVASNNPTGTPFKVYPNPANNYIFVEGGKDNGTSAYYILDITGKIYSKGKITPGNTNTVSLSDLAQGVYFLRISGINGSQTFKVLKL
ncbi:MAG: T9SS type A sorting domain-containing protein [Bacteroidales bacterium]|nr:T9SS type A sorting domain-containing protein [Bacteroidales bacterium]MCF8456948.1 T9SS type A sorting domain-containing protein [Bacteroidales bacterium]